MKLYRITAIRSSLDSDTPDSEIHWVGSQAEASQKRKTLVSSGFKRAEIETEEVEVPTDKKGLLAWLNAHGGW